MCVHGSNAYETNSKKLFPHVILKLGKITFSCFCQNISTTFSWAPRPFIRWPDVCEHTQARKRGFILDKQMTQVFKKNCVFPFKRITNRSWKGESSNSFTLVLPLNEWSCIHNHIQFKLHTCVCISTCNRCMYTCWTLQQADPVQLVILLTAFLPVSYTSCHDHKWK